MDVKEQDILAISLIFTTCVMLAIILGCASDPVEYKEQTELMGPPNSDVQAEIERVEQAEVPKPKKKLLKKRKALRKKLRHGTLNRNP